MSYGIHIWSSGRVPENSILLADAAYQDKGDYFVREGDGWQVVISRPVDVDPEDIPDEIMRALPGVAYLTEITIEPISAPENVRKETLRLCKALAREMKGAVEDPQEDAIQLPSGAKKVSSGGVTGKDRPVISLIWNFDDTTTFYQSNTIDQFVNVLERYMPDALPRRYGEYEPPKHKFAETGKDHLITFLKTVNPPLVLYSSKPFTYLDISVPKIEKETRDCMQSGLVHKEINPQSYYGRAMAEYRCGQIELQMYQDVFLQPDWNLAVKRLFIEVAKTLKPFCAEIIAQPGAGTAKDIMKMLKKGLARTWYWRGIPRNLGYAIMLDEPYTKRWDRFQKAAAAITDGLYMVDNFGEATFKSVMKKTGKVPRRLVVPRWRKTAKYFPFENALVAALKAAGEMP